MAPPRRPVKDRIMERVDIDEKGCWIWRGPIFKDGYGAIGIQRTGSKRAHRISYQEFIGPIPDGMWVLHRCDVPRCVNPQHLFAGTPKQNTSDCWRKGRNRIVPKGSDHPLAKISEVDVWVIRALRKIGLEYRQIGDRYGLCFQSVHLICANKTWKHVDMPAMREQWARTNRFAIALAAKKAINRETA